MAGGRRHPRRRLDDSDSDSDQEGYDGGIDQMSKEQRLARLACEDLSNATRDRQTAHDKERDRQIDQVQINRTRRCNQELTAEADTAAKDQDKLSNWSRMSSDTTGLDNIAGGQYHRLELAAKVAADRRQLMARGLKDVTGEDVDTSHVSRKVLAKSQIALTNLEQGRGGSGRSDRGCGQRSLVTGSNSSGTRPLDPAVDPDRNYTYSSKSRSQRKGSRNASGQSSVRGGRAATQSEHTPSSPRHPLTNAAIIQKHSSLRSSLALPGVTRDNPTLHEHTVAQRRIRDGTASPLLVHPASGNPTDAIGQLAPAAISSIVTARQAMTPAQISEAVQRTPSAMRPRKTGLQLASADDFMSKVVARFASLTPSVAVSGVDPKRSDKEKVPVVQPQQCLIAREELARSGQQALSSSHDGLTDGLLTPIALSAISSPSVALVDTDSQITGLGVSGIQTDQPVAVPSPAAVRQQSPEKNLLDDDAPFLTAATLEPQASPPEVIYRFGFEYRRVPESSSSAERNPQKPPNRLDLFPLENDASILTHPGTPHLQSEQFVQTTPSLTALAASSEHKAANPFDFPQSQGSASSLDVSLDLRQRNKISSPADAHNSSSAISPPIRATKSIYSSRYADSDARALADVERPSIFSPKTVEPLGAVHINVPIKKTARESKRATGDTDVAPSFTNMTSTPVQALQSVNYVKPSLLGDSKTRGQAAKPNSTALGMSKYAREGDVAGTSVLDRHTHGIKRRSAGVGYEALVADLRHQGITLNSSDTRGSAMVSPSIAQSATSASQHAAPSQLHTGIAFTQLRSAEMSDSEESEL